VIPASPQPGSTLDPNGSHRFSAGGFNPFKIHPKNISKNGEIPLESSLHAIFQTEKIIELRQATSFIQLWMDKISMIFQ
jgi:hypothetical protein